MSQGSASFLWHPGECVALPCPTVYPLGDSKVQGVNKVGSDSRFAPLSSHSPHFYGSIFKNHKILEPDGTCDPPSHNPFILYREK